MPPQQQQQSSVISPAAQFSEFKRYFLIARRNGLAIRIVELESEQRGINQIQLDFVRAEKWGYFWLTQLNDTTIFALLYGDFPKKFVQERRGLYMPMKRTLSVRMSAENYDMSCAYVCMQCDNKGVCATYSLLDEALEIADKYLTRDVTTIREVDTIIRGSQTIPNGIYDSHKQSISKFIRNLKVRFVQDRQTGAADDDEVYPPLYEVGWAKEMSVRRKDHESLGSSSNALMTFLCRLVKVALKARGDTNYFSYTVRYCPLFYCYEEDQKSASRDISQAATLHPDRHLRRTQWCGAGRQHQFQRQLQQARNPRENQANFPPWRRPSRGGTTGFRACFEF